MLAQKVERFCAEGWVNIIGGCCGTTAEHIRMLEQSLKRTQGKSIINSIKQGRG